MGRDKAKQKTYARRYMRERYRTRKLEAIQLLGGHCVRCGSTENLELVHADRTQKAMPFSRMYAVSRERFEAELKKYQLLCKACHIAQTIEERGHNARSQHGTLVGYQRGKCRCELCRKANAKASRKYKKRSKPVAASEVDQPGPDVVCSTQ